MHDARRADSRPACGREQANVDDNKPPRSCERRRRCRRRRHRRCRRRRCRPSGACRRQPTGAISQPSARVVESRKRVTRADDDRIDAAHTHKFKPKTAAAAANNRLTPACSLERARRTSRVIDDSRSAVRSGSDDDDDDENRLCTSLRQRSAFNLCAKRGASSQKLQSAAACSFLLVGSDRPRARRRRLKMRRR